MNPFVETYPDTVNDSEMKSVMSEDFEDLIQLKGSLTRRIIENGEVILDETQDNLIVNVARENLARAIAEGTAVYVVDTFALGDGNHAVGDILTPVNPDPGDTGLENQLFSRAINSYSYPASSTVEFSTTVERNEANGAGIVAYTEAGLFSDHGMFAIRSFPAMVKNNEREFQFLWRVIF